MSSAFSNFRSAYNLLSSDKARQADRTTAEREKKQKKAENKTTEQ
jgi:hypothetical protein